MRSAWIQADARTHLATIGWRTLSFSCQGIGSFESIRMWKTWTTRADSGRIRVGLTDLSIGARSAMFALCPKVTTAARQIAQLVERCKTVAGFNADPTCCVVAVKRGSGTA